MFDAYVVKGCTFSIISRLNRSENSMKWCREKHLRSFLIWRIPHWLQPFEHTQVENLNLAQKSWKWEVTYRELRYSTSDASHQNYSSGDQSTLPELSPHFVIFYFFTVIPKHITANAWWKMGSFPWLQCKFFYQRSRLTGLENTSLDLKL